MIKSSWQLQSEMKDRSKCSNQRPIMFLPYKPIKQVYKIKNSQWTVREKAKYAAFIKKYAMVMDKRPNSKLWRVYLQMEKFIKTRNFRQCKQYHQKLCAELKSIQQILKALYRQFSQAHFLLDEETQLLNEHDNNLPESQKILPFVYSNNRSGGSQNISSQKYYLTSDQYLGEKTSKNFIQNIMFNKNNCQQWVQCHRLFLEWTSRLNQLMLVQQVAVHK